MVSGVDSENRDAESSESGANSAFVTSKTKQSKELRGSLLELESGDYFLSESVNESSFPSSISVSTNC